VKNNIVQVPIAQYYPKQILPFGGGEEIASEQNNRG